MLRTDKNDQNVWKNNVMAKFLITLMDDNYPPPSQVLNFCQQIKMSYEGITIQF